MEAQMACGGKGFFGASACAQGAILAELLLEKLRGRKEQAKTELPMRG